MTFDMPGAPDWQDQQAPTTQLLQSFTYNTAPATQSFDLTPFMQPHYQGIGVRFARTVGAAATSVIVQFQIDGGDPLFIPFATLTDGAMTVRQVLGAVIVQGGHTLTMLVTENGGGTGNTQGTLEVYGLTYLPMQNEWNRPGRVWQIVQVDRTAIGAGVTQNVLPAPATGFYYRLKSLTARANAAPAAGTAMVFAGSIFGVAIARYTTQAVANDSFNWSGDLWFSDGIDFTNGSAVGWRAEATAELWPLG